jgi:polygalacturonase
VSQFSQVQAAKGSCKDITINNLVVPGGKTLDLQKLKAGTRIKFSGTTVSGKKASQEILTAREI